MPPLARPEREDNTSTLFIDPATRANLELVRTLSGQRQGSLLTAIDRTVTGAGARLLAERLMAPLTSPEAIDRRLDSISFLMVNDRLAQTLRQHLRQAPDMPRALSRLALDRGGPRDLGMIRQGIEAGRAIAADLARQPLPSEMESAFRALEICRPTCQPRLEAALAEELPLLKRDGGFVRSGHNADLDGLRDLRDKSRRVIAAMEGAFQDETGIRSLKIRHNNILGYYIEVTANNAAAMTDTPGARSRFIHRQTMANAMRFTTTELAELEEKIASAADRALVIELAVFDELTAATIAQAEIIRSAARALAVIDVAQGLSELAESEGWCRPKIEDSTAFRIVQGRHAVVEQALRKAAEQPFMPNDCDLSPTTMPTMAQSGF